MTSRLVKALNARRASPPDAAPPRPRIAALSAYAPRHLSIRAALDWAFCAEKARLDFAEAIGDNARPGVSPVWVVMQRGHLGCSIDGGGHSLPHHDADMIASAVANLPAEHGGKRMALTIADHARAGSVPDWGRDLRPRCIPRGWKGENQGGPLAQTELVEIITTVYRGRTRTFPVYACPVTYTATEARIHAARMSWLNWVQALTWLACDLSRRNILSTIRITDQLPVTAPWLSGEQLQKVA